MRQQVIIPWRDSGEPWRKKHFDFLMDYYLESFDVLIGNNSGEFNRAAARNAGVQVSNSEISVIIDADNYIPHQQIFDAIRLASSGDILAKPFGWFGYLTEESTNDFYHYEDLNGFIPEYIDPPQRGFTGGAYVIRRSLWMGLGGMDEGFIGWGAEDDALHLMLERNGVKIMYVDGYDYHLYHPAHRVTSRYNYEKLIREYVNGNKSPRK
jgi:glycosyltransferase involved in cell wall biosynthesis